jgi:hypothetical protein
LKKKLKVTIVTEAEFDLDDLECISTWRDDIRSYGTIIKEDLEVIETDR